MDQMSADAVVRLIDIMRRLRDPDSGCPWDIEQTFDTILPYTIEEAYEVADAIQRKDWKELESELGDLLLQAVYHAQMGSEAGVFDFASVADRVCRKMIDRHPHVFGNDRESRTAAEQENNWEEAKARERETGKRPGTLDGVAKALPALTRARKIQQRAAGIGFDWPDPTGVLSKVREEFDELDNALDGKDPDAISEEFGDLLFSCVNLARHLGLDPEAELRSANDKFVTRFEHMERAIRAEGKKLAELDLDRLEQFWLQSKVASGPAKDQESAA